jgi:hypothetical protein
MTAPLEAFTREEQQVVIRFLGSEGEKPAEIHWRMKRQYGDACVSLQQVDEWHRKFESGASTVTDAARSNQPQTATTPDYRCSGMSDTRKPIGNNRLGDCRTEGEPWLSTPHYSQCAAVPQSLR